MQFNLLLYVISNMECSDNFSKQFVPKSPISQKSVLVPVMISRLFGTEQLT